MAKLNVFVSFEFDKDNALKNAFYKQSECQSHHNLRNYSLNEPYQENVWKGKARKAIKKCHVVIVLVGRDTHNAPGVIVETDMAKSLGKPTIQILSNSARKHRYKGISHINCRMSWNWKAINAKLDSMLAQRR